METGKRGVQITSIFPDCAVVPYGESADHRAVLACVSEWL